MKRHTLLPPAVIFWSGKGGVGKSTLAAGTTWHLANRHRIAFFDADLYGPSAPRLFGVGKRLAVADQRIQPALRHGIRVVSTGLLADPEHAYVWHGHLLRGALTQLLYDSDWGDTELMIVDAPPGTGELQSHLLASLNLLGVIVVSTPAGLSLDDVKRSLRMLIDADVRVLAIAENMASMACPSCAHEVQPFQGDNGGALAGLLPEVPFVRLPLMLDDGAGSGSPELISRDKGVRDLADLIEERLASVSN